MRHNKRLMLVEHFVNLWGEDVEKKEQLIDEVWDMIDRAYAPIGGPHKEKEELLGKTYYWKLVRKGGKIVACCIYKAKPGEGRKLSLCASDGTQQGKQEMLGMLRTNMQLDRPNTQSAWAEVSEAIEHYIIDKWGVTPIPADVAVTILQNIGKGDDIVNVNADGYHYTRLIDGEPLEKVLVGYPPENLKQKSVRAKNDLAIYPNDKSQMKDDEYPSGIVYEEIKIDHNTVLTEEMLYEDKVVKFDGQTYPDFGWCVIMCGAPGSGKSTVLNNIVPIDARIYNPDRLKELAVAHGVVDTENNELIFGNDTIPLDGMEAPYTLKNPEYVSHLHKHLKPLDRKNKQSVFDAGKRADKRRLPNVAFDIAGSDIEDLRLIFDKLQPLGYKFCIVWVFNTLKNVIRNNAARDRNGLEKLIIQKYFDVLTTIPMFMKSADLIQYVDNFWIVLPVEYPIRTSGDRARYVKETNVKKIDVSTGVAELTDELVDMIFTSQEDVLREYSAKL